MEFNFEELDRRLHVTMRKLTPRYSGNVQTQNLADVLGDLRMAIDRADRALNNSGTATFTPDQVQQCSRLMVITAMAKGTVAAEQGGCDHISAQDEG
jgi:hypothetical protein